MFATKLAIFLSLYAICLFIIFIISKNYKVNSWLLLLISLLLTPITGFIILFFTEKKNILDIEYYKCPRCGVHHTEWSDYCPNCLKEGEKVKLKVRRFKSV